MAIFTIDQLIHRLFAAGMRTDASEMGEIGNGGDADHAFELVTLENAGHFELIAPWTPAGKWVVKRIVEALK